MAALPTAEMIAAKRDGATLSASDIIDLVVRYTSGSVTDAQMAAFAMAVCWQGLDGDELEALCDAMIASGDELTWDVSVPVIDKHSTGGVGDKVSLVLAPLCAAAGAAVPMLSGRGLGHTGGTLDKLESIPGFQVNLSAERATKILDSVGCFVAGAGPTLVPADAKLYALRDQTGTVPSPHLIAASIMSKKIAGGAQSLVVDTKWGSGAFCRTRVDAVILAGLMGGLAERVGLTFDAALTEHHAPTGRTIGNACEVAEALDVLDGRGPTDIRQLTVALAERLLTVAGIDTDAAALNRLLETGAARERFDAMVAAQGGNPCAPLPRGEHRVVVSAAEDGHVRFDAHQVGVAAWTAGAGRDRPGGPVDHSAGITLYVDDGAPVRHGTPFAVVEGAELARVEAAARRLADAAVYLEQPPTPATFEWWSEL